MAGQLPSSTNKADLRAAMLARRDGLDRQQCARSSKALCRRLGSLDAIRSLDAIAGYASIRNEIDAHDYLVDRHDDGADLYFPRVVGKTSLIFVATNGYDALTPGAFGVPEPEGPPATVGDIDLFLVPGVAFDRRGCRLGFGRGYYDRALARGVRVHCRDDSRRVPLLVGICYHWQLADGDVPVETHDVSMDLVVTDREVVAADASSFQSRPDGDDPGE